MRIEDSEEEEVIGKRRSRKRPLVLSESSDEKQAALSLPLSTPASDDFKKDRRRKKNLLIENERLVGEPKLYNPAEAHGSDWNRALQKTVELLEGTLKCTPIAKSGSVNEEYPPGLVKLYKHQEYALRWMSWREKLFPGGGVLADEMGLGKTVMVIALVMKCKWESESIGRTLKLANLKEAHKMRSISSGTTLIVAPLGLITQWVEEISSKGNKRLKVYLYHGNKKTSSALALTEYDVVVTTYQTIAFEMKKAGSPIKRVYWHRIILDEAHNIRNPTSRTAQAIYQLNGCFRWAVTGTPIHNSPQDFFSMCRFLRLSPFDDRQVWEQWIGMKAIKKFRGAQDRLHILGKSLILRRTKAEIGAARDEKIPTKTTEVIYVDLNSAERRLYKIIKGFAQRVLIDYLTQRTQPEPRKIQYSHVLAMLIRMRQCAVLPYLISGIQDVPMKNHPIMERMYISSKIKRVLEDVEALPSDEKVIIVSSWTGLLKIMCEHLTNRKYSCVFLTGEEDIKERKKNVNLINSGKKQPQILLLSLKAGGVGLNLIGANNVFIIEPHWNPMLEAQAEDRTHRFGQTKNVLIRRYISLGTIEGEILDLQKEKQQLADGLLDNSNSIKGQGISINQIKHFFDIHIT